MYSGLAYWCIIGNVTFEICNYKIMKYDLYNKVTFYIWKVIIKVLFSLQITRKNYLTGMFEIKK